MNFSGNVFQTTLDLLSTFSHQQLKTIEAALSSSTTPESSHSNSTGGFFEQQQLYFCQTPPTWNESETTTNTTSSLTDFDELDSIMNNLSKGQPAGPGGPSPGAGAAPTAAAVAAPPPAGAGAAAPVANQAAAATQFAEYLAMQQQAQQYHQQLTQQQNQALAAAAAAAVSAGGHYPGGRPFDSNQLSALSHQVAAVGMKINAGHGHAPPPAAQVHPGPAHPQQMGHHVAAGAAPAHHQQNLPGQAQRQPLALTSNVSRPGDPPQQVPQPQAPVATPATVQAASNNNTEAPGSVTGAATSVQPVS